MKKHKTLFIAVGVLAVVIFVGFVKVFDSKDGATKITLLDKISGK